LENQALAETEKIHVALERIDEKRLEALPCAPLCIKCAS
jgi:RNA polymerase-binding transcription factor DksA